MLGEDDRIKMPTAITLRKGDDVQSRLPEIGHRPQQTQANAGHDGIIAFRKPGDPLGRRGHFGWSSASRTSRASRSTQDDRLNEISSLFTAEASASPRSISSSAMMPRARARGSSTGTRVPNFPPSSASRTPVGQSVATMGRPQIRASFKALLAPSHLDALTNMSALLMIANGFA